METVIIIILSLSLPVLIYIYSVLDSDADVIIRNQQTLLENIFNGEIVPPPMKKKFVPRTSLLETIDKETHEYTWWFILLSVGALFIISFGAFFISCCKDISSH